MLQKMWLIVNIGAHPQDFLLNLGVYNCKLQ